MLTLAWHILVSASQHYHIFALTAIHTLFTSRSHFPVGKRLHKIDLRSLNSKAIDNNLNLLRVRSDSLAFFISAYFLCMNLMEEREPAKAGLTQEFGGNK